MFFSLSKNTRNRKRKRKAPIFIHKLFQNFILKGWIKYFNKYLANQAQNISANEENDDDLKFLNRPVDKKIDDEKRKSSKKTIDEENNDVTKEIDNIPDDNSEEKSGKKFLGKENLPRKLLMKGE